MKKLMILITFLLPVFPASAVTIFELTPANTYSLSPISPDGDPVVPTSNQFAFFAYTNSNDLTGGPALFVDYGDVIGVSVVDGVSTISNLDSSLSITANGIVLATRSGSGSWWFGDEVGAGPAESGLFYFRFSDGASLFVDPIYATLNISPVSAVPVPAAVWLFGSGLIGLAGIARRKKA